MFMVLRPEEQAKETMPRHMIAHILAKLEIMRPAFDLQALGDDS